MKTIKLILIFSFFSFVFIFPLVSRINYYIPGFASSDEPYAVLWNFWWLKYAFLNNFPSLSCPPITVPFSIGICKNSYPLWNFINKWLSILTSNIFAYNLQILFSFILSAIFMYYLAYYLNKSRICSFVSAIIYAFCPYHFTRAWQHLGLAQIQWMPLYLFTLLKLKDKPDLKHALLVSLAFFLVFSFDLYYAYFMFIVTIIFFLFLFIYGWKIKLKQTSRLQRDWNAVKMIFISGILVFFLTLPSTSVIVKEGIKSIKFKRPVSVFNPYRRPFEDLFAQSAKPLSYLLPHTVHPVFGKFTEYFIGSSLYGVSFTEQTLYLGWIPLILAFVAIKRWRKMRKVGTVPFGDSPYCKENFYIGFFIFLAVVAWLFSQPPWWKLGPLRIYMPSFFMYKIAPMFRAYCRFGIVVMLAVAVLAGFGLKFILEKFNTRKTKIIITVLFSSLILFEFWNYPPFKVIDVSEVPAVYYWLKEQAGDFVIAEYPIDAESTNEVYKFYQTVHEKKIINGTIPETYANKISRTLIKLSEPGTTGILKWMGVKYALVHREDYLRTELTEEIEELDKIPQNPGLKLIKTFPPQECPRKDIMCVQKTGQIDVYEVVVLPIEPRLDE